MDTMLFSVKEALRLQAEKDVTIAGFSLVSSGIPQSSPLAAVPEGGPQTEGEGMDLERSLETPSPMSRSQSVDRAGNTFFATDRPTSTFYVTTPPSHSSPGGNTLNPSTMGLGLSPGGLNPSPLPSPRPGRRAMSTSVLPDPGKLLVPQHAAGERLKGSIMYFVKIHKSEQCLDLDRRMGYRYLNVHTSKNTACLSIVNVNC